MDSVVLFTDFLIMLGLIHLLIHLIHIFHDFPFSLVYSHFLLYLVCELVLHVVLFMHPFGLHLGHGVCRFFGAVVGLIHTLLLVTLIPLARQVVFDLLLEE